MLEALVTAFRDLRAGRSAEGWEVERPSTVMSTAEAVAVAALARRSPRPTSRATGTSSPSCPVTCSAWSARTTRPTRRGCCGYWDGAVRRRAEDGSATWRTLWDLRAVLED